MMTPKMKEDFCGQILTASRQLFLSAAYRRYAGKKEPKNSLNSSWN